MDIEQAKRDAVLEAVRKLKTSPFKATAIKVEMEGGIGRTEDCDWCTDWFNEHLSDRAKAALVYLACYPDGGDTEITFTISLADPTNVLVLPEFIDLYNELSREAGSGHVNVSNAGMHMALLNDSKCRYPGTDSKIEWRSRFENMQRSCSLLMPALFFLGSTYENTRSFSPRYPRVSYDKYSAVHGSDGCLEFRVFDTCYNQPGIILDNVVVMANVMQFFRKKYKPVKMGVNQVLFGKNGRNGHQPLESHYTTKEHIRLLNAGLNILKPSYYSIEDVKAQRKFGKCEADCADIDELFEQEAKARFVEYNERMDLDNQAHVYFAQGDVMAHAANNPARRAEIMKSMDERVKQVKATFSRHTYESFKKTLPQPKVGDFMLEGE